MTDLALLEDRALSRPTLDEPIPSLAGAPGLRLLRSDPPRVLARTVTGETAQLLAQTCHAVLRSLSPATVLEMGAVLEGLGLHYPQLRRTDGENRIAMRHWAEDLEGWPLDLLAEAARLWRNSDAERFPTPGQLKATARRILEYRQALGRAAAEYLRLTGLEA